MINGVYHAGVESGDFSGSFGYFLAPMPMLKFKKEIIGSVFQAYDFLILPVRPEHN